MSSDDDLALLVVPFDTQVSLHLKEGSAILDIDLTLQQGQNIRQIVNTLIEEHHIAYHNEQSLLYTLSQMIELQQEYNWEGIDDNSSSSNDEDENDSFSSMFHKLFFSNVYNHIHLAKIEQQMNRMYQRRIQERDKEITRVRERHSSEMERICDDDNNDISTIVRAHIEEMEQVEQKWEKEFRDLKNSLVKQYLKFIKDLFKEQIQPDDTVVITNVLDLNMERVNSIYPTHTLVEEELKSLKTTPQDFLYTNNVQQQSGLSDSYIPSKLDFSKYKYVSSLVSYFQNESKKVVAQPIEYKIPKVENYHVPATLSSEMFECFIVEEFDFKIYVVFTDQMAECLCRYSQEEHHVHDHDTLDLLQRSMCKRKLYENQLNALILTCSPHYSDDNELKHFVWNNQEYYKIGFECTDNSAPELHFDELPVQLENIVYEYNHLDDGRMADKSYYENHGRSFITKHSNLSNIHLIYHLITSDHENTEERAASIMLGVEDVVQKCLKHGVITLSIPLPLTAVANNAVFTGDIMLEQMSQILRMCFNGKNPDVQKMRSLKNVLFFLPRSPKHSSGDFHGECQNTILRILKDFKVQRLIND
jgi:hypothetical protein